MKSLKHNAIMNTILSISTIVFPLITYPYVARVLGVEMNGRLSFAQSTINYFALFATLGITTYGIKACAQVRDNKEKLSQRVQELVIINIVTTAVVFVALVTSILLVPQFRHEWLLLAIYSLNMVLNVAGLNWMYSALEEYDYITIRSIAFKFISLILMFIFVHNPSDGYIYALITVLANVGSNILNIIRARKYISFKLVGDFNFKQHLKPTIVLFSTYLAVNVYTSLDHVMLGFIQNEYQVGIYHTAVRIQTIMATLVTSIGAVLMPRLSYYAEKKDKDNFFGVLKKSYKVHIMLAIPIALFFIIYAMQTVLIIAGSKYHESILPMQIIMFTVVTTALSNIIGMQIFIPLGKENAFLKAVVCGAVINIILNALLMPKYGPIGAAIATLVAQIVQFVVQAIQGREYVKRIFVIKDAIYILIASVISGAISFIVVKLIPINLWHIKIYLIASLVIGAIVFFGVFATILWIIDYKEFTQTVEEYTKGKIKRKKQTTER